MKKILLIEDDVDILELYTTALQTDEYDVLSEQGGRDGLAKAKGFQPDLILLDILMKGMDGIEVLRNLKSNTQTSHIPVIMLTNVSDPSVIDEALKLGAQDCWQKTQVTPKELYKRVSELFK